MEWLSVVIEEYKTLREESLASMQMQQSILRFGAATMGIVIAAGFNVWDEQPLSEIIFLFFVPLIVYLILIIWAGEVARMFRAGRFLTELERKINNEFSDKPDALTWENWLLKVQDDGKTPHQKLHPHYVAIFLLFAFSAMASIIIGNFKIWKSIALSHIIALNFVEASFLILVSISVYKQGKQFKK